MSGGCKCSRVSLKRNMKATTFASFFSICVLVEFMRESIFVVRVRCHRIKKVTFAISSLDDILVHICTESSKLITVIAGEGVTRRNSG